MRRLRPGQSTATTIATLAYVLVATGLPTFLHLTADHSDADQARGHCAESIAGQRTDDHDSTPPNQPKPAQSDCKICWQLASIAADDPQSYQVTIASLLPDLENTIESLPLVRQAELTSAAPRAPPLA